MGCDIHLYVETKDALGQWQSADTWEPNKYYDENEPGEPRHSVPYEQRFYTGRNYELFAILANVRNGVGFAGVKISDGFNPIDMPRGLPTDVSELVKQESDHWDGDGHRHSYFTIKELLDYDWTQTTKLCGYVDMPTFYEWNRYGRKQGESPDEYAGGVSGRIIDETTMLAEIDLKLKAAGNPHPQKALEILRNETWTVFTFVEWEQPYYRTARYFWSDTMPRLLKLAHGNYDNVRIVFWFDN